MSNTCASDDKNKRGCFYVVLMLLIQRVSLETIHIEAVTRGAAILQCSNNDDKLKIDTAEIYWRFNDSKTVLDIKGGGVSLEEQEAAFRGRVDSFPEEYPKGNFSIRLRDVRLSDTGAYSCFIPDVNKRSKVELIVKESKSSDRNVGAGNGDVRGGSDSALLFFASLLGFFVLHP